MTLFQIYSHSSDQTWFDSSSFMMKPYLIWRSFSKFL